MRAELHPRQRRRVGLASSIIDTAPPDASATAARPSRGVGRGTALFIGVVDAALTVAVPVVLFVVVGLLVWAVDDGASPAWTGFYDAAADLWLIGHGVDIRFDGIAGTGAFTVSIAALGPALITAIAGIRAGARLARTDAPLFGGIAGAATVAACSLALLLTATTPAARPVAVQAILLPAAVYGGAALVGIVTERRSSFISDGDGGSVWWAGLRAGVGAAAVVCGGAALAVAALLALGLPTVIGLYEGSHSGAVGGLALTVAQLALLPTFVVWAASWMIGPGFSIGVGSSISPLGTQVGPLPSLPLLGVLPTGSNPLAFAWLLVPVLAGFLVGVLTARRARVRVGALSTVLIGLIAGVIGGGVLGLLAAAASGAAGPGRLGQTGPDALMVALIAAAEIGLPAMLGLATAQRRGSTLMPYEGVEESSRGRP